MWSFLACIFTPLFTLSDYNLDSISDCTNLASNPPSAYSIIPYYRIFTWPVIVIVIFVIPEQLTMSWIISWFCFSNLYNLIQDQDQGPCLFNDDNNDWFLYIVLFQLRSKGFMVYYYPSHWIHVQFCTHSALSPLPTEHRGLSPFFRRTRANSTAIICLHPTESPFIPYATRVERSSVE